MAEAANRMLVAQECVNSFKTIEAGKNTLTPELLRKTILEIEERMLAAPEEQKVALETSHHFADQTYVRTVFMKAGSLITGRIHKLEHIVIVSKGSASIACEEYGPQFIKAPMVFISRPLVKRILFIHEDMVFSTVHPNPDNIRDLAELERRLTLPEYEVMKHGGGQ